MGIGLLLVGQALLAATAASAYASPDCLARGTPLPVDDAQVIFWKHNTPNQFQRRGHVIGIVSRLYSYTATHAHFEIALDQNPADALEVIYNQEFGALPTNIAIGSRVEACGDYITSTQASGPYPSSPDGAIIHWIHMSPNPQGHDSGFLIINGVVFGQQPPTPLPPRDYPPPHPRPHPGYGRIQFDSPAFYGR